MKSISHLFALALVACMSSCKDNENNACLDVITPAILDFKIVDESSGIDLFFSENPPFDKTNLTLRYRIKDTVFQTLNLNTITSKQNHYFSVSLPLSTDTIFLQINTLSIDTITYSAVISKDIPCSTYELESLKFNKMPISVEDNYPLLLRK